MHTISIIIPAFNAEKTLEKTICSATLQSLDDKHYEIIIIDDGSTDDTYHLATSLAKSKNNIKVFQLAQNKGQGAARNYGVSLSLGCVFKSSKPYQARSECYHSQVGLSQLVISGGNAAKMFQFIEKTFNKMALFIHMRIILPLLALAHARRDNCFSVVSAHQGNKVHAVIPLISNEPAAPQSFDELRSHRDIVNVSSTQQYPKRVAETINSRVNFCGKATAAAAYRLRLLPPFEPALCWWARTYEASIMRFSISASSLSASRTCVRMAFLDQRKKRVYTLFHGPYRSGKSRQGAPLRKIQIMPLTKSLLSLAGRPGFDVRSGGKRC